MVLSYVGREKLSQDEVYSANVRRIFLVSSVNYSEQTLEVIEPLMNAAAPYLTICVMCPEKDYLTKYSVEPTESIMRYLHACLTESGQQ